MAPSLEVIAQWGNELVGGCLLSLKCFYS